MTLTAFDWYWYWLWYWSVSKSFHRFGIRNTAETMSFNVSFSFALTPDCFRNKPPSSLLNIRSVRSPATISNTPAVLVPFRRFNRFFLGPPRSFTGRWLVNLTALSDRSNVLDLISDMRQSTHIWFKALLVRFDGTLSRPSTRHNLTGGDGHKHSGQIPNLHFTKGIPHKFTRKKCVEICMRSKYIV